MGHAVGKLKEVHVLITSVSKKVPLIQAVKKTVARCAESGSVWGADNNPHCIGRYFVDLFWQMPKLEALAPEECISYCLLHGIRYVIPTRDGELSYFAKHKRLFLDAGISVMVSDKEGIDHCLDKLSFSEKTEQLGVRGIETAADPATLAADRLVVKERFGAGGRSIGLNLSKQEALAAAAKLEFPLFQPFMEGQEVSCDLYIDKLARTKGVIARTRDVIEGGESQVTTAFKSEEVESACSFLAKELGLYGHVMFQFIRNEQTGAFHLLECNPRFGGASTLSLAMGLDSFVWFFYEGSGVDLSSMPFTRCKRDLRLVRHAEDYFV